MAISQTHLKTILTQNDSHKFIQTLIDRIHQLFPTLNHVNNRFVPLSHAVPTLTVAEPPKEPTISTKAEIHHPQPPAIEKPSRATLEHQSAPTTAPTTKPSPNQPEATIDLLSSRTATDLIRRAEVISELETKISTAAAAAAAAAAVGNKKPVAAAMLPLDEPDGSSSSARIAPAENSLANFTITTYARQKSLDIFEQPADQDRQQQSDNSSSRLISAGFATLSRGRSVAPADYAEERARQVKAARSMERVAAPLADERINFGECTLFSLWTHEWAGFLEWVTRVC